MVVSGNDLWRGASAPTPFWSRTIDVDGEITGLSWSDREGVASRRALFAHRTGISVCQVDRENVWVMSRMKRVGYVEQIRLWEDQRCIG